MKNDKKLEIFAETLSVLCGRSPAAPGKPLRWTVIANPTAGGFTINKYWKNHEGALFAARAASEKNPRRDAKPSALSASRNGFLATGGPGNAGEITAALIGEAGSTEGFYLVVTAGGDGTSLEVLQALFAAPENLRRRFAVVRLPMGTGNDGADSPGLAQALELLYLPSITEKIRGVRLSTASGKTRPGGKPFLAFNILSVGLDAFVTHMTNKMKGGLPGDSYKLWVDIAALFYDKIYKVAPLYVQGYDASALRNGDWRTPQLRLAEKNSARRQKRLRDKTDAPCAQARPQRPFFNGRPRR